MHCAGVMGTPSHTDMEVYHAWVGASLTSGTNQNGESSMINSAVNDVFLIGGIRSR